jgi:diguanylate cyclase (GGDEF)-like protein
MQDLNGLKQINDSLGHLTGDKAITAVATALKESCPPNAICVRAGGDELLAFIPGDCDIDQICNDIEKRLVLSSQELGFTVSASTGTYSTVYDGQMDIGKIIGIADERMYEIKRNTKNSRPL